MSKSHFTQGSTYTMSNHAGLWKQRLTERTDLPAYISNKLDKATVNIIDPLVICFQVWFSDQNQEKLTITESQRCLVLHWQLAKHMRQRKWKSPPYLCNFVIVACFYCLLHHAIIIPSSTMKNVFFSGISISWVHCKNMEIISPYYNNLETIDQSYLHKLYSNVVIIFFHTSWQHIKSPIALTVSLNDKFKNFEAAVMMINKSQVTT